MAGEHPYLLAAFMLRLVRQSHIELTRRLWDDLDQHRFRAVVLDDPPDSRWFFDPVGGDFGPGFIQKLEQNYTLTKTYSDFWLYLPREQAPSR